MYCPKGGGEVGENTPLTGAYESNPAVTAYRVSSRVLTASESDDPTYSRGTGKLKDKWLQTRLDRAINYILYS
jgi:hypothetical protein